MVLVLGLEHHLRYVIVVYGLVLRFLVVDGDINHRALIVLGLALPIYDTQIGLIKLTENLRANIQMLELLHLKPKTVMIFSLYFCQSLKHLASCRFQRISHIYLHWLILIYSLHRAS